MTPVLPVGGTSAEAVQVWLQQVPFMSEKSGITFFSVDPSLSRPPSHHPTIPLSHHNCPPVPVDFTLLQRRPLTGWWIFGPSTTGIPSCPHHLVGLGASSSRLPAEVFSRRVCLTNYLPDCASRHWSSVSSVLL